MSKKAIRNKHYMENWQAWISLRHFLPISLLRELVCVIIKEVSAGEYTFRKLFNDVITKGSSTHIMWALYPKEVDTNLGRYLQAHVKAIAWQNDLSEQELFGNLNLDESIYEWMLDVAIKVGIQDSSSIREIDDELPSSTQISLITLVSALKLTSCISGDLTARQSYKDDIVKLIDCVELPLQIVLVKHIGDMCADANHWIYAREFYCIAKTLATDWNDENWTDLKTVLITISMQSIASADKVLVGGGEASEQLREALMKSEFNSNPMLFANATFDAFAAQFADVDVFKSDKVRSTALMYPSLLIHTHNISNALSKSQKGDYLGSSRCFWASLRRQIALGSSAAISSMKILYARNLLNQIESSKENLNHTKSFQLAVNLIIESEYYETVNQITWYKLSMDKYVSMNLIRRTTEFDIGRYRGVEKQRKLVIVNLFKNWVNVISASRILEIKEMYNYIINQTRVGITFNMQHNVTKVAYEALIDIAKTRPEFRVRVVDNIVLAFCNTLRDEKKWQGLSIALEAIQEYIDVLNDKQISSVVEETIDLLSRMNPDTGLYPVVRPALSVLINENTITYSKKNSSIEKEIVKLILHYGLNQDSEKTRVFLYLRDFGRDVIEELSIRDQLKNNIDSVLENTKRINRSSVIDDIKAILITSQIFGYEGLRIAVQAIIEVVDSMLYPSSSSQIVFSETYELLIILYQLNAEVQSNIEDEKEQYNELLTKLMDSVIAVWEYSSQDPSIFASISFTATPKPNPIIVHNWAFASQQLAILTGREEDLNESFATASEDKLLEEEIIKARGSSRMIAERVDVDRFVEEIAAYSIDAFYAAVGKNLVILNNANGVDKKRIARVLFEKCLLTGPRELDVAIFLSANGNEVIDYEKDIYGSDYLVRVRHSEELRTLLFPIVDMIKHTENEH